MSKTPDPPLCTVKVRLGAERIECGVPAEYRSAVYAAVCYEHAMMHAVAGIATERLTPEDPNAGMVLTSLEAVPEGVL
jgi:hypothetical protein